MVQRVDFISFKNESKRKNKFLLFFQSKFEPKCP